MRPQFCSAGVYEVTLSPSLLGLGGARSILVLVVEKGIGHSSSNPG